MKEKFYPAQFEAENFHCPYCGVYSHQYWSELFYRDNGIQSTENIFVSICTHCFEKSVWYATNLIQPSLGGVPLPNNDLPEEIISDYNEASSILNRSPRGASALLRLAIQKLLKHLGQSGKNINDDIANLVKTGLSVKVQQALDYVRVIGNNSVHPGQIDLKDNTEIALNLFNLINIIADVMITQPKEIEKLYNSLPKNQIESINERDKKVGL